MLSKICDSYENTVVLPKCITLTSTYQDVISAYGAQKFDFLKKTSWISCSIDGMGKYEQNLTISFDKNTKVITSIKLKSILDFFKH